MSLELHNADGGPATSVYSCGSSSRLGLRSAGGFATGTYGMSEPVPADTVLPPGHDGKSFSAFK